jgi:hypothetical protein
MALDEMSVKIAVEKPGRPKTELDREARRTIGGTITFLL